MLHGGNAMPGDLTSALELSPYLRSLQRNDHVDLNQAWASRSDARSYEAWMDRVRAVVMGVSDEADLMQRLRWLRQQEQARFIFRELSEDFSSHENFAGLSAFADACIKAALAWLEMEMKVTGLIVLALGKLGGEELNLSSDIDLIFACTDTADVQMLQLQGQRLIRILDALTGDGRVFRVDMRLRPWGEGSALVYRCSAMEAYYEQHGRDWERYALVKARPVAGACQAGEDLLTQLRPFIFRRYIDFGALQAVRQMKALIEREERRRGDDNIKLGVGGIREIEFIVQVFQLLRGGRDRELQSRSTLTALAVLENRQLLPAADARDLRSHYLYLRHLEHILQAQDDRQTQVLPVDPVSRQRVALAMGYLNWQELEVDLVHCRQRVQSVFRNVVSPPSSESDNQEYTEFRDCWSGLLDAPIAWLTEQGYADAALLWQQLSTLASSRKLRGLSALARERLDTFMPMLIKRALQVSDPGLAVMRLLPLVESVLQRTVYLVMLMESPERLMRLLEIVVASPWIAEELARYPILLDELLSTPTLTEPPSQTNYRDELQQMLLRLPEQDLESSMQVLRLFQKGRVLQVAAADVNGQLPLMQVSDALTHIAEAVLEVVLNLAWRDLTARHGLPGLQEDRRHFMVVAYGKLGGLELGYGSDLDLVFIHDGDEQGMTTGPLALDQASFFARLGQKMIHILTASMAEGRLYEVDMRLRPSGHSGLLVTSIHAFQRYQEQAAWLWEHQALVRARPVVGDEQLAAAFAALRQEILCRPRDLRMLAQEVAGMREKMHKSGQHAQQKINPQQFYIKHDAGGIVDIEFMVQYGVLAWAHNYPELTRFTDNVRILEGFVTQHLLAAEDVDILRRAYMAYRKRMHRLALAQEPDWVDVEEFGDLPDKVRQLWAKLIVSV